MASWGHHGCQHSVASGSAEGMVWLCPAPGQPHPEHSSLRDKGNVLECVQKRRTTLVLEGMSWEEAEGSGFVWFGEKEAEGQLYPPLQLPEERA